MPLGKQYEFNLLHPLGLSVLQIEPIWIRLSSHAYKSWDQNHLDQLYVTWEEALAQGPLDGLIITGAPVEHLPFEQVHYWTELVELIEEARRTCASTLGLCWAGLLWPISRVWTNSLSTEAVRDLSAAQSDSRTPLDGNAGRSFPLPPESVCGLTRCRNGGG